MTGLSTRSDVLELKEAVAALDRRFEERFNKMETRFDRFGEQLQGLYKTIVWSVVASVTVLAGIFSAIITILIR
jgi:hypothetical protein